MSKFLVQAGWSDSPHLTEDIKRSALATIQPHQVDARTKGIPYLGAGRIYPMSEESIMVEDFAIPDHWPRGYALDVGWNVTAALWMAHDRDTGVRYFYSEYYAGQAEPVIHAAGIKARGEWIPGLIDPAARGRSQVDGQQLVKLYRDNGLDLRYAQNAVEAGIYEAWTLFSTGQAKVFKSCQKFFSEFRVYRRNEKGQVVKERDHLVDDLRYLCNSGVDWLKVKPVPKVEDGRRDRMGRGGELSWMS